MEIKPLLIFYGMTNYARSLVVARNFKKFEALQQKHGIKDKSKQNSRLEELTVEILEQGIFQEFNDTVCILDGISFTSKESMTEYVSLPTSNSENLKHKTLTLRDILARISDLESLYSATFGEEAKTVMFSLGFLEKNNRVELRIDDKEIFTDIDTRQSITEKWQIKYPFLKDWYLIIAERAWDHSILVFANVDKNSIDKLSDKITKEKNGNYYVDGSSLRREDCNFVNFWEIIDPAVRGLICGSECLIEPFDNTHISELSLYYLGMFLLSSLVRYRPQIWGHSISRLVTTESPSDDKALALIESFMRNALATFPTAIVKAMSIPYKEK